METEPLFNSEEFTTAQVEGEDGGKGTACTRRLVLWWVGMEVG